MSDRAGPPRTGWALRSYLLATRLLSPVVPHLLRRRLARGKEDPARVGEKLGQPSAARPDGRLVWLHAVGLGEVMALRGLVESMAARAPDIRFLVTSTARSSGQVFAANLPPRTVHQFLPVDAPAFYGPFLDHWRPDLSVWSEQDLWPGIVTQAFRRGIPLALVNVRLNARAAASRGRAGGLYRDLYRRFTLIGAQDEHSARALEALGAAAPVLRHPSLKTGAPPLAVDEKALIALKAQMAGRRPWCLASSHPEDEAVALAALRALPEDRLLILAPRLANRGDEISTAVRAAGLTVAQRSRGDVPDARCRVLVADTFGEMGLWYRLCPAVLMGGTFGPVEGHNPWEPARLGAAVLHGPRTANFRDDYAALDAAGAAVAVTGAEDVAATVGQDLAPVAARSAELVEAGARALDDLGQRLLALLPEGPR